MIKISLAVPRDNANLVKDLFHLNGFTCKVELRGEEPAQLVIDIDEEAIAAFKPHETIAPRANA